MMFFLILIIVIIIIIAFVHYNKHENDAPENEYTPTNKYVSVNKTIPATNVKRKSAAPFDGYRLIAALDSRTCLVCGLKDGRVFKTNTGALRLNSFGLGIIALDGIWLSYKKDSFLFDKIIRYTWEEINNIDIFNKIFFEIGNNKTTGASLRRTQSADKALYSK